jgi:hypothetical protein
MAATQAVRLPPGHQINQLLTILAYTETTEN